MVKIISPHFEDHFVHIGTAEDGSRDLEESMFLFRDGDEEVAVHGLNGYIHSISINGSELRAPAPRLGQSHFLDAYINGIALPLAPELIEPAIQTVMEMSERSR